jgi:hypothetical protein
MAYDPNQAHPKIDFLGTYPNLHVIQDHALQILKSLEPGKESLFQVLPTGNYTGFGPDGAEVSVTVGKKHQYNADGKSTTTDGHQDEKVGATKRSTISGDAHTETAGNKYDGNGGVVVSGSNDSQITHSSGDVFHTSEGNHITDHTGSVNHNFTGDYVEQTTGNKIVIVNGENGVNVQTGNMDTQVSDGKYRIKAAKEILVDSDTSITLRVGDSIIVITTNSITATVGKKGISIKSDGVRITKNVHVGTATVTADVPTPISPPVQFK